MFGTKFCRGSLAPGAKMDRKMGIEIKSFLVLLCLGLKKKYTDRKYVRGIFVPMCFKIYFVFFLSIFFVFFMCYLIVD